MASRKDQKATAKAVRLEAEKVALEKKIRNQRFKIFGGAIGTLVIIGVIVLVVLVSGSQKFTAGTAPTIDKTGQTTKKVDSLLAGIPQKGETLGDSNAKVSLSYYGDLQCPVCKAFSTGTTYEGDGPGGLTKYIQHYVKSGLSTVSYKSLCTATCNDYADGTTQFTDQQVAAYAAGKQNKFWNYAELFYEQQGTEGTNWCDVDNCSTFLDDLASQSGLNFKEWKTDRNNAALATKVNDENTSGTTAIQQASGQGAGTPAIFITGPKGTKYLGTSVLTYSQLVAAYNEVS